MAHLFRIPPMMRLRLFEFEDLPWFPSVIRQGMTDYLRFVFNTANLYKPAAILLGEALEKNGTTTVLDLCSGSGGNIEKIQETIQQNYKRNVNFILSDKFPNLNAFKFLSKKTNGRLRYIENPVDAVKVPENIQGLRTIFSGFHHFERPAAVAVLKDAVRSNKSIAIFDGGDRNLKIILAILIGHTLTFFFCTPFFRPLRFSTLLFTYILPIIPICTIWDGLVSVLRLYKPQEMLEMAREVGEDYNWKSGKISNSYGMNIAYLIGHPREKN